MQTRDQFRDQFLAARTAAVIKLARKVSVPCVPEAVIGTLIAACIAKREARWLRTPARLTAEQVEAVRAAWPEMAQRHTFIVRDLPRTLSGLIAWHGSSGSLYGPITWRADLGPEAYDALDTLAVLVRVAAGLPLSPAGDRWRSALGY
jgi:hypothetical protein